MYLLLTGCCLDKGQFQWRLFPVVSQFHSWYLINLPLHKLWPVRKVKKIVLKNYDLCHAAK